ncbi:Major facilitator superfamily, (MFS_1) family [Paraburkholderia piptadeniae]|uniref:MFS transporter n=2 Tax=Paraburkholderia TaxID=1822464 RepID=A0A7X1NB82_9BURK|nr:MULTISPECIES: MFS transporter [Paraburkholderia]MPW18742.1 MFS transporter [Paraburkholderia franconis]SIT48277.1 Major facilitator superfamily, (MFS_1) family [Paraburkholderia piptadeniae]
MQDAATSLADAPSAPRRRSVQTRTIIATSAGNALEMFDFTVFSYFAALIGKTFFPVDSGVGPLLLAMATFGVGFVMRPLGGILIGNYADRAGRRAALTLTIQLMIAGTAIIALTPSYARIGVVAPVLVVIGRLLQGLSAGGEVGASTTLLMESGPLSGRGFMVSWQVISQGVAALLGALCGALLSAVLSADALESWGWRIPFLLGLLLGPVGFYIRRHLDETHTSARGSAVREVFTHYLGRVVLGTLLSVGCTSTLYIFVFYMPAYAVRTLHLPMATSLLAGCASGLSMIVAALVSGRWIIDRLPRRKPMIAVTWLVSLACVYPAFRLLIAAPSVELMVAIVIVVMAFATAGSSAFLLLIMEAFPQHVRATALATIYSVGVTVFGGFAQFNVTWLLHRTGDPMSPAWYVLACGAVSMLALWRFRERPADTRDDDGR